MNLADGCCVFFVILCKKTDAYLREKTTTFAVASWLLEAAEFCNAFNASLIIHSNRLDVTVWFEFKCYKRLSVASLLIISNPQRRCTCLEAGMGHRIWQTSGLTVCRRTSGPASPGTQRKR